MKTDINTLKNGCKELTILYAEDDAAVAASMLSILQSLFSKVYYGENGVKAHELYFAHKKEIDFVISDIQMPQMNGLELSENLKADNIELPIVIMTAFSDKDYFLKSIDIGIDKYLIKPINQEKLYRVLYEINTLIENRKKVKELERQKFQREVNKLSEFNINQLVENNENPMVVYRGQKVTYFNTAFSNFFDPETLKLFVENAVSVDVLFLQEKGFVHSVYELNHLEKFRNKIAIRIPSGKKYFYLTAKEITFAGNQEPSTVYTFYDITWLEYERNKAKNYAEVLEEIIVSNRREQQKSNSILTKYSATEKPVAYEEQHVGAEPVNISQGFIETTDMDKDILRRSRHKQVFTSEEFLADLDNEVYSQLNELESTESELNYLLEVLSEDKTILALLDISRQFNAYADVIGEMIEFEDLAYAIRSFCQVMNGVNEETFSDDSVFNTLSEFMSAFVKDLSSWRRTVFIDKSAKDIHYLDSSLLSSCMQIEVLLYNKDNIDEGEDLIFF